MKKDSKTKIARVYALALYEAAEERKAVPQVSDDMMKLLDAVRADAGIVKCLANPLWGLDDKKAALREVAARMKLNAETLNCLDLIAENGRVLPNFRRYWKLFGMSIISGMILPKSKSERSGSFPPRRTKSSAPIWKRCFPGKLWLNTRLSLNFSAVW